MKILKKKRRMAGSSAALLSIALHLLILFLAGGIVALRFYGKKTADFQIEEQKRLERRKLQMPIKTQPFIERMSRPSPIATQRLTANTPKLVNIPEQGEYVKMVPMPTFKGGYTNFVQINRTLEFNSKYREVSFGVSAVDFFGTRGKAEKVVLAVDVSSNMVSDPLGGLDSFSMVYENLRELIAQMRSATLFNVVLFDGPNLARYKPLLVPATSAHKTNVLEWVAGINTNVQQIGLPAPESSYTRQTTYEVPLHEEDISGWLRGMRAAVELEPEIIFLLAAEWGSVADPSSGVSYFLCKRAFETYLGKRLAYFLADDDLQEEWDEYLLELEDMHPAALKMLELENQAREEMLVSPKITLEWDEILVENKVELPEAPMVEEPTEIGMYPAETRYTLDEVLQTLFTFTMEIYRQNGFPKMNFVLMRPTRTLKNSAEKAAMMTSDAKFKHLSNMVDGRFRYIDGARPVRNALDQSLDEVLDILAQENPENPL